MARARRAHTPPGVAHDALLRAASKLLAEEGPDALTVRRIADEAGVSTMGVYTHFGGKEGVVDALFAEGFAGLRDALARIRHTASPLADVRRGCRAYREFALAHPTNYLIMFERAVPDFEPSEPSMALASQSLALLEHHVERAITAGAIELDDPVEAAHAVWATCHGLVSLELHGLGRPLGEASRAVFAQRFDTTIDRLLDGLAGGRSRP